MRVLLLAAAVLAAPALAAQERIVSVTIVGERPAIASRYDRYVGLKVGEPLRQEDVRRTVRHLFATGAFEDVSVEATARPGGTALTVRLQAAPRLARIRVEGDDVLSGGGIRRVTRLRDGDALWRRTLDRCGRDAALALADEGYLEARVTATCQRMPGGAEAVFRVQAGPQTLVSIARVAGAGPEWKWRLERVIAPKPGRPFSRRAATAAAAEMQSHLRRGGFWESAVSVRETYDPQASRIELVFDVDTGPRVELVFRDQVPDRKRRKAAHRILEDRGLTSGALEEVAELIEEHYRKEGFRLVTASYEIEERPQVRRVVFTTRPGARSIVGWLRIEGAPDRARAVDLVTRVGGPLDEGKLDHDMEALTRELETAGYPNADVSVAVPERAGRIPVTFRLRPGRFEKLGAIRLKTKAPLPATTADDLGLEPGAPYDVARVSKARSLLVTAYRNAGYPRADVRVEKQKQLANDAVDLTLEVEPGPRVRIDRILIAGLLGTREETVRRELLVHEGDILRWDRVLESHRRLISLGLFRGVVLQELDPEEPTRRSLLITVDEGPRTTLTYGLGAASLGASDLSPTLRASAEVTRRNLGGLGRSLSLFARLSFRGSRFLTTYHEPFLLGRRANLSVTAFREDEERSEFTFDRLGGGIETTRTLSPAWSLVVRYIVSRTHLSNVTIPTADVDRQYHNARSSGPSLALVRDTRNDPVNPQAGSFFAGDAQLSHAAVGGHSFLKGFVQSSAYRGLRSRLVLAVGVRLGAAATFRGQDLDLPERFFAGGHYTMRGFDTDGVLPQGGRALCVGGVELRQSLTRHLSVAVFTDIGNVFPTVGDVSLDLRRSAGAGLRYQTPVGPIRVDWARNLDPREGEDRDRFHITVGHAF
jgi:outer membrane protein insertion porin family